MDKAETTRGMATGPDGKEWQTRAGQLLQRLETNGYAGWDPFDALNSRLFNASPLALSRHARLAWTQVCKRSPLNLRRIALVEPTSNVVTLALAAEMWRRRREHNKAQELVDEILRRQCEFGNGSLRAWGYPFAWQSKAFYVPKGAANIIATAYCVRELMHWRTTLPAAVEAIVAAARYTSERLGRSRSGGTRYVAYVENSDAMVHNANLWGVYVLAAGAFVAGRSDWITLAAEAVNHSVAAQKPDGSWPYGEAAHHGFIDGFHTGYVLEALHRIDVLAPGLVDNQAILRGFNYYHHNLFEADGTAKYYSNNRYPIDANAAAQAIITVDALGLGTEQGEFCFRIAARARQHLWIPGEKRFAYQRSKQFLNRMDYPRWTQIWMALAFQIMADNAVNSVAPAEIRSAVFAA